MEINWVKQCTWTVLKFSFWVEYYNDINLHKSDLYVMYLGFEWQRDSGDWGEWKFRLFNVIGHTLPYLAEVVEV